MTDEMTRRVGDDLRHIPDWPGVHQSTLRMLFNNRQRSNLAKAAPTPAGEVLLGCVELAGKEHPGVEFLYDREHFGV